MTSAKKFRTAAVTVILLFLVVSGILFAVFHSFYYEPKPLFRPMFCYNQALFWDEKPIEIETDSLEYIGEIKFIVPNGHKPVNDFECNSEVWLGSKIYKSKNKTYYLELPRGTILLLNQSKPSVEITTVIPF